MEANSSASEPELLDLIRILSVQHEVVLPLAALARGHGGTFGPEGLDEMRLSFVIVKTCRSSSGASPCCEGKAVPLPIERRC